MRNNILHKQEGNGATLFYVPDICRNTSVLILVLLVALVSTALSLFLYESRFLESYGRYFFYLCWLVFLSVFLVCKCRSKLNCLVYWQGLCVALSFVLLSFALVEGLDQYLDPYIYKYNLERFCYRAVSVLIVTVLVLSCFSLGLELSNSHKAEADAKIKALQLRINPHFLFNTLNTIAELTNIDPKKAEEGVESLAMLFRASLENEKTYHALNDEIRLCERYLELEKLRLDKRLNVTLMCDVKNSNTIAIPKLLLQPLVENSVIHGVEPNGEINLKIDIKETKELLSVLISNGNGANHVNSQGNGVAHTNIKERLFVLYDDRQKFRVSESDHGYSVFLSFPKQRLKNKRT